MRLQPGERQLGGGALLPLRKLLDSIDELDVDGEGVRLVARQIAQRGVLWQVIKALDLTSQHTKAKRCVCDEHNAELSTGIRDAVLENLWRPQTGLRFNHV